MNLYWANLDDFIRMGGYGLYVWGSFGVTALALATEVILLRVRGRQAREHARRIRAQDDGGSQ